MVGRNGSGKSSFAEGLELCLTDAQTAAVLLYERGLSLRAITDTLGISCRAVRDRLDAAARRIVAHEPQEVPP